MTRPTGLRIVAVHTIATGATGVVIFWSSARWGGKMCVAPSAFAAFCRQITLFRFGKIEQQLVSFRVKHLSSDRHFYDRILAVLA